MKIPVATLVALLWPALCPACAVCYAANDRNRAAFFGTTLLLTLLPLGMIAAGALWVVKRGGLKDEFADRDAWTPGDGAPAAPLEPGR